jgi:hypothetical protein
LPVAPIEALLDDTSDTLNGSANHGKMFVVELAHNDSEILMFLTQKLISRNNDLVKMYKGGTRCGGVGCFDSLSCDAFTPWNKKNG